MRYNMLATAVAAALGVAGFVATPAYAADKATSPAVSQAQLQELKDQLAALQAQIDTLQQSNDAQSDVNVVTAQSLEEARANKESVDKLAKLVNDTKISGKMFIDLTSIDQKSNGAKTDASGVGIDVKRFYLGVDHKFNETWSANLTTDFQYNSKLDSAANLYVKKAYVQGKFDDAFVFRAGSADLPWIPFTEGFYGFRYVENTLTDRLKFGTSADWGLHAGGDLGDKTFNYAVSMVNGGGYKNPSRSKSVDFEGRVGFMPIDGMVIALGGYSGKLGKETENIDAQHTATRGDAMVAYNKNGLRLGVEYFQAKNWNNVLIAASDKADGYSLWGSYAFGGSGIAVFARYDQADLSKDIDPSLDETYYNVGVEFPITKGIKVAAVYKDTDRENDTNIDLETKEFGVWGEIGF